MTARSTPPLDLHRRAIPVEETGGGAWLRRCARTLVWVCVAPWRTFATCPEPVEHGKVLRFLATLRLPLWVLLITLLGVAQWQQDGFVAIAHRSVHTLVDPQLARASSTWLLLMVPVGMPLLYFTMGLLTHVGIGLTGGAPRSLGATMRAVGYGLGPALLAIAVLDLPLHLRGMDGTAYLAIAGFVSVTLWALVSIAVGRTHRISVVRGVLVTAVPVWLFAAVTSGRAALELRSIPGIPAPQSPYYVP